MTAFSEKLSNRPASFALMSFGMSARVVQGFTNDPRKLERALAKLARETNGLSTHAYDAVDDAVRLLQRNAPRTRSEEHTSELQSRQYLVCRLLLEKKYSIT